MDNPNFVTISDPRGVLVGAGDDLWLPLSESPHLSKRTETIDCGGLYFDVIGYSEKRDALMLRPIKIDGAADDIEAELNGT